jgi:plasmid stabilization system protein ParE
MSGYSLTPAARKDLLEIIEYLLDSSADAAEQMLDDFETALARLARYPEIGHLMTLLMSPCVSGRCIRT